MWMQAVLQSAPWQVVACIAVRFLMLPRQHVHHAPTLFEATLCGLSLVGRLLMLTGAMAV